MGLNNFGTQSILYNYRNQLKSTLFGSLDWNIKNGIYKGFQINKISDFLISITAGSLIISDTTGQPITAKIDTSVTFNLTVSSTATFLVIARWQAVQAVGNFTDFMCIQPSDLLVTDVVLGKLVYSLGSLITIDYSYRSFGNLKDETILVDPESVLLYINPGTNFYYINSYTINYVNEVVKTNFINMTGQSTGNYYLYYNGTSYGFESDTTIISYSFTKNGWYDTNGYRILASFTWDGSPTNTISSIIKTYTKAPSNQEIITWYENYLNSALKEKITYNVNNSINYITYYNDSSIESSTTTIGIVTLAYNSNLSINKVITQIYYPVAHLYKTHTQIFSYNANSSINTAIDTIS